MDTKTITQSPMTPREISQELDNHIIGQDKAKRAVAIALRNRWRRQQVSGDAACLSWRMESTCMCFAVHIYIYIYICVWFI